MRGWAITAVLLTPAALLPRPAHALLESCTVSALPVTFGSYSWFDAAPLDSTGQVTVTCTATVSISVNYTISLSTGGSGSYSPRKLTMVGSSLNYNLYADSAYSQVWGDGSAGTTTVSDGYSLALLLVSRSYPVYGRLFAQQNVAGGLYGDTITVTINY